MSNRPRMPTTAEIAGQVTAMFTELEARWPGSAGRLGADTINMLTDWGEVTVHLVPESAADGGCTVTAAYLHDDGRAIVAIAQSASPGRRAFTACHELGHHLQRTTDHLIEALLNPAVDGHALEESACNSFAAQLLIPEHLTTRHIGPGGPTAHDIVSLWRAGQASRQAVCARAAERLFSTRGHVLLLDEVGLVTFGSSDPWSTSPRRGSPRIASAPGRRLRPTRHR